MPKDGRKSAPAASDAQSKVQLSLIELTRVAYAAAPDYLKYPIFASGIIGLLVFAIGARFAYKGETNPALIAIGLAMLFYVANSLILLKVVKGIAPTSVPSAEIAPAALKPVGCYEGDVVWSRLVPKFPLQQNVLSEVGTALEELRTAAFTWLKDNCPEDQQPKKSQHIRANLFFPGYIKQPPPGDSCVLSIPQGCSSGMEGHPDREIKFRPGQGLAGIVFVEQEERWAVTLKESSGHHFESIHNLTEEQQKALHPDLRWIVAFPILVHEGAKLKAAGVLGVDGLGHQPEEEKLKLLMAKLLSRVVKLREILDTLPKSQVLVGFREDAEWRPR